MSADNEEVESEKTGQNIGEGGPKLLSFRTVTEIPVERFGYFDYDVLENIYAPFALDLSNMGLTDIYPIKVHSHLRFLQLGNNYLDNKALEVLEYFPYLISLYLNNNRINSTTLPKLDYLQQLNLTGNPITLVEPIDQPLLQILILDETKIDCCEYVGLYSTPSLQTLSACHCLINDMTCYYALSMVNLFLSYNGITKVEGLEGLVNLKILHLRHNRISKLDGLGVGLVKLEYLNLRENEIADPNEIKTIKSLLNLRVIILSNNPINDEMRGDMRPLVLMHRLELQRINKQLTDEEEVQYARSLIYEVEAEEEDIYLPGAHVQTYEE